MEYMRQIRSSVAIAEYAIIVFVAIRAICYFLKRIRCNNVSVTSEEGDPKRKTLKKISSAPWIPFLGSLPFMGRFPEKTITKWGREDGYGSVFRVRFGTVDMVILNDYESIREGFVRNGHRISGRFQTPLIQEMTQGNGLLFLDYGDKWRSQRKFGHQAFRKIGINANINKIVAEETQMLVSAMDKQINDTNSVQEYLCGNYKRTVLPQTKISPSPDFNNNDERWELVDTKVFIHKTTANVMCNVLFGRSFGPDENEYNAVLEETPIQANKSFAVFMLVFLAPTLRNMPYIKGVIDEALCLRKATFKMIRELVDKHIDEYSEMKESFDFVDCFLHEMKKEETQGNTNHFTYEQLLTFVFDLFTAGSETTADTIMWVLLYLARNPTLQNELRDEIITIGGEDYLPSVEHMSKMHLVRATMHETIRIRPLNALGVAHTATRESEIQGFHIPKDSIVVPNIWSVQHNAEVFPNPEEFIAHRHISETGEFTPSKHVIAFSVGPRQCIGKKIAEINLFFILTSILRNFEFRLPKVWNSDKNCFITTEPDMKGTNGHVLLPPDFELEWRTVE